MSTGRQKPRFRISEKESPTQEVIDEIKEAYKSTEYTKNEQFYYFRGKYGLSPKDYWGIVKQIPDRKRYHRRKFSKRGDIQILDTKLDKVGGLALIKALKLEGWSLREISTYLGLNDWQFSGYLKRKGTRFSELPIKTGLDDSEISYVKKKYRIMMIL